VAKISDLEFSPDSRRELSVELKGWVTRIDDMLNDPRYDWVTFPIEELKDQILTRHFITESQRTTIGNIEDRGVAGYDRED